MKNSQIMIPVIMIIVGGVMIASGMQDTNPVLMLKGILA